MSLLTLAIYALIVFSAVVSVIALLPDATCSPGEIVGIHIGQCLPLPDALTTALHLIFGYAFAWNTIFPVTTLLAAVVIVLVTELLYWAIWRPIRWGIGVLRGYRG